MKTHHASKQQHGTRANDVVYRSVTSVTSVLDGGTVQAAAFVRVCGHPSGGAIAGQLLRAELDALTR